MTTDSVIDAVAREFVDFSLEDVEDEGAKSYENYCADAFDFHGWTEDMLDAYVRTDPTPVRLAQAKVLLIDRYFEWRASVGKSHRNHASESGHVCLFHVFVQAYQQLKRVQLTVTPPLLFLPPPPARPQINGIFLGDDLGQP